LILILHACLYFVVFPNASLALHWIGGSFVNHCLTMGLIWSGYLTNIFMPWTVKMIPGLYSPPVPAVLSLIAVQAAAFLIVAVMCLPALWRSDKKCFFFLSWYFIFYLPVSNLLPIANPMACRFMYLPSIGLLIVLAFFLNKVFVSKLVVKRFPDLSRVLFAAVLVICATRTFFLNADWKSNFDVGWACVRDYPAFARGYALLGVEFYNAGLYKEAKGYAEKSVLLKDTMPKEVLNLAKCYVQLKEFKSAESLLKQIINNEPAFIDPYVWLGIVYDEQNKVPQARQVLDKALNLDPKKFIGYKPLIKVYLEERNFKAAGDLLKKADLDLNAEKVAELRRFLKDTIAVQAKK